MVEPLDKKKKFNKSLNCFTAKSRVAPGSAEGVTHSLPTICQRSNAVLKGLDLVLEHHGAPQEIREDLSNQMHSYLDDSSSEEVWLKRAKDALTYFLAKYLKNPLPPSPDHRFNPKGALRRWLKARCNAFNRKNTHFWYSWYQSKRSTLPLSEDFVQSSYRKHFEALTKPDPGDPNIINDIMGMPIFEKVLDELSNKLRLALERDDWTKNIPSGGACFEQKRKGGGQFGRLVQEVEVPRNLPEPIREAGIEFSDELYDFKFTTELWTMVVLPSVVQKGIRKFNQVVELRVPLGYENWISLRNHENKKKLLDWSSFGLNPDCTIQAIKEPNKIRIISKEPALLQYYNKSLQKSLHSIMRKMDCFRLIGRPFCPTDMIDLTKMALPTDWWYSVDYSAATDNLSYRYSSRILQRIVRGLSTERRMMAMYSFGPHELYYPVRDDTGKNNIEHWGTMTNGNLMGGIISFLILCLSNLGLYLRVTRLSQLNWTDEERLGHVLINGDDMVYAADPSLWETHVRLGNSIGLEMSIGKAYCHPVYFNINSTSGHYDIRKIYKEYEYGDQFDRQYQYWDKDGYYNPEGHFVYKEDFRRIRSNHTPYLVNYLNSGLFFGQHKVQGQSGHEDELPEVFQPYRIQDYPKFQSEISFRDFSRLVDLGVGAQYNDLHRNLMGLEPFWKARSLSIEQLQRTLLDFEINGDHENLISSLNTVIQGALPGRRKDLLSKFIETHKDVLKKETLGLYRVGGKIKVFTRNLFLPISLGGLGVNKPIGFKTKISKVQKSVARSCLFNLSNFNLIPLSSQRPLPGYEINQFDPKVSVPWKRTIPDVTIFECGSSDETYPCNKDMLLSFQAERFGENPSMYSF